MHKPALLILLTACQTELAPMAERDTPMIQPGELRAGVAVGDLDAPVGAPLGGYTGRCTCFGGDGEIDDRDTAYTLKFNPSVGSQTRPTAKVLWLDNGDQDFVLLKTDSIFAFEGIGRAVAEQLSAETGKDLHGRVVLATSHSHSAPGGWDQGLQWFLGFDRYNAELFERMVAALTATALDAYAQLEPASIGLGQATNWDPEDRVYRDRRGDNNDLSFFPDIPAGPYKDPYLSVLRVDRASDGSPMGVFFAFGMHGTVMGGDSQLFSSEAGGHVELAVEEAFAEDVVVAWLQHGGGDASPAGWDNDFARMEVVGANAAPAIVALWGQTPTGSGPVRMETVTHGIDSRRDVIGVDRPHGRLVYAPYDEDAVPDQLITDDQGQILTPIDEFNTWAGAAFCGDDQPIFPNSDVGGQGVAYASCADVSVLGPIIGGMFNTTAEEFVLPLPESETISAAASRIGPMPILEPDGSIVEDDLLLAFLPGEATAMLTEQFRRRAADELGMSHTLPIGYSVDHMGYMLIPEDWLTGGYEPNINLWGPLQAEHVMEGILDIGAGWLLTDAVEPMTPRGTYPESQYPTDPALPTLAPDATPEAGTLLDSLPEGLFIGVPGLAGAVAPDAVVPRVQGIVQLAWEGGDPAVDLPRVSLQRREGADWVDVRTGSGRKIDDQRADILVTTTPDPLGPADAAQVHRWWAAWQAVGSDDARVGLPEGEYRLHVEGERYSGGATTWPWPSETYTLDSPSFEIVPATLALSYGEDGLRASIPAHPQGFRMIDSLGASRGNNPTRSLSLDWEMGEGVVSETVSFDDIADGIARFDIDAPEGATAVVATDPWGNRGRLTL